MRAPYYTLTKDNEFIAAFENFTDAEKFIFKNAKKKRFKYSHGKNPEPGVYEYIFSHKEDKYIYTIKAYIPGWNC